MKRRNSRALSMHNHLSAIILLVDCPYRKLDPDILMVETTKHRPSFDTPVALNGPSIGRILP